MKKHTYLILGHVSVVLAILGIALPVLPTTPFAILAAYLYSHSSPKMHKWILSTPILGKAVLDWEREKMIRPRAKFTCTVLIILTISSSIYFGNLGLPLQILLIIIALSVITFVLTRNSYPSSK
jgi:hypothetical protein